MPTHHNDRQDGFATDYLRQTLHVDKHKSYFKTPSKSRLEEETQTVSPDHIKQNMLYATQTDFSKGRSSFHALPIDSQSKNEDRLPRIILLNDDRVNYCDIDTQFTRIKMPIYPTGGPNPNNPTLPSQLMKSPLAKRFELPPTTTIGIVDDENTISLAPPLHD